MVHVLLLLGCAVAIYLACEAFVNAVEWLGVRLRVGPVAVGTVLAAVGTALPESVVTFVAVLLGGEHGKEIGVGAALGGPLVVGTLAYAVVGLVLLTRGRAPSLDGTDTTALARDQVWFLSIFVVKVGLGLVAFAVKPWLGIAFLVAYAVYAAREVRGDGAVASDEGLTPLTFQRTRAAPSTAAVVAQTVVMLVVIFAASQLFVAQLEWAGPALGLSPVVVALLLSPVATELPEILNAVIWVRQGKTSLALGNISGAMMIQATVPSALGLLFTPWDFDTPLLLAGVVTTLSVTYLLLLFRRGAVTPRRLVAAGGFYLLFAAGLILTA